MNFVDKIEKANRYIRMGLKDYRRVGLASSWGKDSMVLLDLARRINPDILVFTIETPFKPKETLRFRDQVIRDWQLNCKIYKSDAEPIPNLWKTNPIDCCVIFKVQPTKEAVKNLDCWFSGLRNTEGETRREFTYIQKADDLIKVNPILEWTETDIWKYSALYNVPQNPLYKLGYRSLGCKPCSAIIDDSEPERAGRWIGTVKAGKECGIHLMNLRD